MKYLFKQAMNLENDGESQNFPLGVHEVSEKLQEHWYFGHCLKCGLIVEPGKNVPVSKPPTSAMEHAKQLDEKLAKQIDGKLAPQKKEASKGVAEKKKG